MMKFFETFLPEACGMDFTEVNFLQSDDDQAEIDMLTVRLIIERVVNIVHNKQKKDEKKDSFRRQTTKYQYGQFWALGVMSEEEAWLLPNYPKFSPWIYINLISNCYSFHYI